MTRLGFSVLSALIEFAKNVLGRPSWNNSPMISNLGSANRSMREVFAAVLIGAYVVGQAVLILMVWRNRR